MAVQQIEGVRAASFSYPEGTGTVTFDTTMTSATAIIAELGRATGYTAIVRNE